MGVNAMAAATSGAPLLSWSYESGPLGPHDCVLRVLACGLCHSDLHMVDNDWGNAQYPLVPGHEVVGEVVQVGALVQHLQVGDRAGVGWQRSACLQCPECLQGKENLCDGTQGLIVGHHGGFADMLQTDGRFCFKIPDGIDTLDAGPLLCGGVTVYSALRSAGMTSGQEVGIIGVGGLGHMAVQFAAKLGNRVTVFTTSEDKAEFATEELGAHAAYVVKDGRPPATLPHTLDVLCSTAPVHVDWDGYLNLMGSDATLTIVGAPPVHEPLKLSLYSLLMKRRRIMASPIGGRAEIIEMLSVADRFGVRPIIEVFSLARINDAIAKVRDNTIRYRAVIEM